MIAQAFQKLAQGLPRAKHVHSKLVCPVSGQMMDEHNLPMVMPNGTVYSEAAVKLLTGLDGRTVTCPKTGESTLVSRPGSPAEQVLMRRPGQHWTVELIMGCCQAQPAIGLHFL